MTASDLYANARSVKLRGPDKVARYIDCRICYRAQHHIDHMVFHPDDLETAKLYARARQKDLGAHAEIILRWTNNN